MYKNKVKLLGLTCTSNKLGSGKLVLVSFD